MADLQEKHEAAARALRHALTLNTPEAWGKFATVICLRLSPDEIAGMAYAALRGLPTEFRGDLYEHVEGFHGNAGMPMPIINSAVDDAQWWVSMATPEEIDAYATCCFLAMSPEKRKLFAQFINAKAGAA